MRETGLWGGPLLLNRGQLVQLPYFHRQIETMIIYNVTVKIDHDVHEEWLTWMREKHIPEVLATGRFLEHRITRVMVEEEDGVTYAFQYTCKDMHTLEQYHQHEAPALQADHLERYKDKFVAFRTLLEVVE